MSRLSGSRFAMALLGSVLLAFGGAGVTQATEGDGWYRVVDGDGKPVDGGDALLAHGDEVYAAASDRVMHWDGSTWHDLGLIADSGMVTVRAMALDGTTLYVGGTFVGGTESYPYVGRWDGNAWHEVGQSTDLNGLVLAMAVYGGELIIGGAFTDAGGVPSADHIARWGGGAWHGLAVDQDGAGPLDGQVLTLATNRGYLYAGGVFGNVVDPPSAHIARWDGTWHAVPSPGEFTSAVRDLEPWNGDLIIVREGGPLLRLGADGYVYIPSGQQTGISTVAGSDDALFALSTTSRPHGGPLQMLRGGSWHPMGTNSEFLIGSGTVQFLAATTHDAYAAGNFLQLGGAVDLFARFDPDLPETGATRRPDASINSPLTPFAGTGIINATGIQQTKTVKLKVGTTMDLILAIKNSGSRAETFRIKGKASLSGYRVTYRGGSPGHDVTAQVIAGTYTTRSADIGSTILGITVRVAVSSTAKVGSSLSRLVTISSSHNAAAVDAVRFVVVRR